MPGTLETTQWSRLGEVLTQWIGLHFPPERWDDLRRGIDNASRELGFESGDECAAWLLTAHPTREQLHVLAGHLTVGETYFFRDPAIMRALSEQILPSLIRARRGHDQRLRIWSAACSSGEEPYSLAILLDQLLPDLAEWRITITATDIDPRAIQHAMAGLYREWSFRNTPPALRDKYFERTSDRRYAIKPAIRNLVTFRRLNLVGDIFPSLESDTTAMDVVFCRNVLMYFAPAQVTRVIDRLHHALLDGGWLVVSPVEVSSISFPKFATVQFPGAMVFHKETRDVASAMPAAPRPAPSSTEPVESPEQQERQAEASQRSFAAAPADVPHPDEFARTARDLANAGRLADALTWCDRWIAADKMNANAHYLRAAVLVEQEELEEARSSLQRALYLDPGLVLAHFTLGNLAWNARDDAGARKHFRNALDLLQRYRSDDLLPLSEGLTAGRLAESISAIHDEGLRA